MPHDTLRPLYLNLRAKPTGKRWGNTQEHAPIRWIDSGLLGTHASAHNTSERPPGPGYEALSRQHPGESLALTQESGLYIMDMVLAHSFRSCASSWLRSIFRRCSSFRAIFIRHCV